MSFLRILSERNSIPQRELPILEEKMLTAPNEVIDALKSRGITDEELLSARGEYYGIPTRSLAGKSISYDILKYIPEESALHYKIIPLSIVDDMLEVGIVDPDNIEARDALNFISSKTNFPFRIFLISPGEFESAVQSYKGLSGEVSKALEELETELETDDIGSAIAAVEPEAPPQGGGARIIEDAPVTKIVATMLRYATEGNASDIHVEPMVERIRVRFRVDGVLHTSLLLPLKVHRAVVARIKILSNMKLDEKRKPQDGRFSARLSGKRLDFRVSTFPTHYGEKVVIRILDQERGVKKIAEIGFRERELSIIMEAIRRPYGMILISGPTGSGKSTTLYAMLNEIDREKRNVLSLEDPVEYNIEGVSQSQVMPEIGYTFATGLRTTLRQDPDIIMVGEIRDKETAQLAVQAALTGHLVLSTIHTNSAIGVIPRLIDMGVDPYLIGPTLNLAIAQRLVRVLCPGAGKAIPVEGSIKVLLEKQFQDLPETYKNEIPVLSEIYEAAPTPECPNGTRGRMAVFEVLEMNKSIEQIVLQNPTEAAITAVARKNGMLTMKEDAIIKSSQKLIPFEEVNTL